MEEEKKKVKRETHQGNPNPSPKDQYKPKLTEEQMKFILGRIPEGMTIQEMAGIVGVDRHTVYFYRHKAGVDTPGHQPPKKLTGLRLSAKARKYLEQFDDQRKAIDAILVYLYKQQRNEERKSNQ